MTITSTSTLAEVYTAQTSWYPSTTDIGTWADADHATGDTTYTTAIGLFGADLTDFLADCATATDHCDSADYDAYTGWGIGIEWSATTPVSDDEN